MNLDLSKIQNVHFVGIGGIGISAVARMMIHEGKNVTGQDMNDSEIITELKKLGVNIKIGQSFENIPPETDLIVYTIAIETHAPELFTKLQNQPIPVRSYPQMLGILSKDKYTIAVSGTHGKTTTTGMIAQVLMDNEKDPTVVIGSLLAGKTNFIKGGSDLFVVESCEYRRSFLNISPNILIITNIEEDHLDYYNDIEDIKSAFRELALKAPPDGFIVCDPDDKNISDVIKDAKAKVVNYREFYDDNLKLKIPGIHNKKNASCAHAVGHILHIDSNAVNKSLSGFAGTWRRFEFKGALSNKVKIYDDYAHHPTEITVTLKGFRELYPKEDDWRIIVVFQSHLFSRTKFLLNDFAKSFTDADEVIILPIYHAREDDDGTISPEILKNEIKHHNTNVESFDSFEEAESYLKSRIDGMTSKTIIVTMGAGEAFKIGDSLLKSFS